MSARIETEKVKENGGRVAAFFDLDGTLIDSSVDLANSVNATRAHLGLPPMEHAMVYSYVGNGAPVLIRKALGPEYPDDVVASALEY